MCFQQLSDYLSNCSYFLVGTVKWWLSPAVLLFSVWVAFVPLSLSIYHSDIQLVVLGLRLEHRGNLKLWFYYFVFFSTRGILYIPVQLNSWVQKTSCGEWFVSLSLPTFSISFSLNFSSNPGVITLWAYQVGQVRHSNRIYWSCEKPLTNLIMHLGPLGLGTCPLEPMMIHHINNYYAWSQI